MALSVDPLWPRAGDWPALDGDGWDAALVGIPTWRTSLSATAAHTTPAAIREALRFSSADPVAGLRIADAGDAQDPDGDPGAARTLVERVLSAARLVVALGGDNSATALVASGASGLVTLDAHHDLRDGHSNGSPVRELIEAGLDGRRVVQIGIDPFANSAAYAARAAELGITVITRDSIRRPMGDVMAEALSIASDGDGYVHVDLDVDVCDRSVVPACPAAVPGGISARELRLAAAAAGRHPSVRSIDLTEIDATADAPDGRTVRLAALCVLEAIAALKERP
jgi:formiminoglutamase